MEKLRTKWNLSMAKFWRVNELAWWCIRAYKEEVADIAIYLLRICMKLDINLEDAILNKMTKMKQNIQLKHLKVEVKV